MFMYIWKSEAFSNWAPGDIIVLAESIEGARIKAFEFGKQKLKDDYSWDIDNDCYPDKLRELISDVEKEPIVSNSGCWIVPGSA